MRLHPVIKHSPAYVLALYVPTMHHGPVGVCLILVHVSVILKVPRDVFHMCNVAIQDIMVCTKNSSQPLITSADCSVSSAYPASAASTVRKTEERRHQCVGRLLICFCNFHNMLNHATVCFFCFFVDKGQSEFVLTSLHSRSLGSQQFSCRRHFEPAMEV